VVTAASVRSVIKRSGCITLALAAVSLTLALAAVSLTLSFSRDTYPRAADLDAIHYRISLEIKDTGDEIDAKPKYCSRSMRIR